MIYAMKIRMKAGCDASSNLAEIDMIYIEGDGFHAYYKKDHIYDLVKGNPDCIRVDHYPYPFLLPALSSRYEKYVRSERNDTVNDNLLNLPRE